MIFALPVISVRVPTSLRHHVWPDTSAQQALNMRPNILALPQLSVLLEPLIFPIAETAHSETSVRWDQASQDLAHLGPLATTCSLIGTAIFARLVKYSTEQAASLALLTTIAHLASYIHSSAQQVTRERVQAAPTDSKTVNCALKESFALATDTLIVQTTLKKLDQDTMRPLALNSSISSLALLASTITAALQITGHPARGVKLARLAQ